MEGARPSTTVVRSSVRANVDAAIECNNIGVELLQAGKFHESLVTLKGAAQLMLSVSQVFKNWSHLITADEVPDASFGNTAQPLTPRERAQTLSQARERLSLISADSENVILQNEICADPLKINSVAADASDQSNGIKAATIAYNIGLNYELLTSAPFMKKALCVYDMAFSLALSEGTGSLTALNVAIACLNNSGIIYHSFAMYPESRQCMDTLSFYITHLPLCTAQRSAAERRRLLLNTMLLNEPKSAGAA